MRDSATDTRVVGLWEGESAVPLLTPAAVAGAGCSPNDHKWRFRSSDLRDPVAKDMSHEDKAVRALMERYRLEHWVEHAQKWAKTSLADKN